MISFRSAFEKWFDFQSKENTPMKRLTIALAMTVMFLAETHTSPNAVKRL